MDHILSYPGTYDISLRRMYELNSGQRTVNPPSAAPSPSLNSNSPTKTSFPWTDHQSRATQFAASLSEQIATPKHVPGSFPPAFVTNFVKKIFAADLPMVDFDNALTALDYMKDLEMRRRRDVAAALRSVGVHDTAADMVDLTDETVGRDKRMTAWINLLEGREKRADALYTQCYLSVRRWIMIHKLSTTPLDTRDCHAMLNTLYPPVMSAPPTRKLTLATLKAQREGFFKYIQTVEKLGADVLNNLRNQGKNDTDNDGWAAVRRNILLYLDFANSMIGECEDINAIEFEVKPRPQPAPLPRRRSVEVVDDRKDSGFSFSHERKPSKASSTSSSPSLSGSTITTSGRTSSTLERIAREFRRMRPRPRIEVEELVAPSPEPADDCEKENSPVDDKPRRLRKLRSLGALADLKQANSSAASFRNGAVTPSDLPLFDAAEMKRQRDAFEKRAMFNAQELSRQREGSDKRFQMARS